MYKSYDQKRNPGQYFDKLEKYHFFDWLKTEPGYAPARYVLDRMRILSFRKNDPVKVAYKRFRDGPKKPPAKADKLLQTTCSPCIINSLNPSAHTQC